MSYFTNHKSLTTLPVQNSLFSNYYALYCYADFVYCTTSLKCLIRTVHRFLPSTRCNRYHCPLHIPFVLIRSWQKLKMNLKKVNVIRIKLVVVMKFVIMLRWSSKMKKHVCKVTADTWVSIIKLMMLTNLSLVLVTKSASQTLSSGNAFRYQKCVKMLRLHYTTHYVNETKKSTHWKGNNFRLRNSIRVKSLIRNKM